jgi:hypothetical protein
MTRNILILTVTALMLSACGRDEPDPTTQVEPSVTETEVDIGELSLFDRIDTDTVYLSANLRTMPERLIEQLWKPMMSVGDLNRRAYGDMADEMAEDAPLAAALLREFSEIDSIEALQARGLHANGQWAMHAISLYPVVHWQLIDVAAFEATLQRLASESGTELPRRTIDDEELIWMDLGSFGLAMHHDDHFLTIALVPDDNTLLRRIANLDQPTRSYDPRTLEAFNRSRGFTPYGSGFVELGALLSLLLDTEDELVGAMQQQTGLAELAGDETCQRELSALASVFPRVSGGMTAFDRQALTGVGRLEVEPGLAGKLARIANTPVALDGGQGEMLSAGLAFDLIAARDLGREIVGGWVDNPPECPLFSNIRDNAETWQLTLNRPIPPVVTNIRGFRVALDRLVMQGPGGFSDGAGTLAVFMRNPQMLIGMAQMFSPELAALDLKPGGAPQRVPAGMIPNMPDLPAYIALGNEAIGVALGEEHKNKLAAALEPGTSDTAVFGYSINMSAYGEFMQAMMDQAGANYGGEVDMQPGDFMTSMGEVYDQTRVSVHLTADGIDFVSTVTFK